MPPGDLWHLPDGRRAIETGRSAKTIQVLPLRPGHPFPAPAEIHWRAACTKLPSRYLHGAVPAEPDTPETSP